MCDQQGWAKERGLRQSRNRQKGGFRRCDDVMKQDRQMRGALQEKKIRDRHVKWPGFRNVMNRDQGVRLSKVCNQNRHVRRPGLRCVTKRDR